MKIKICDGFKKCIGNAKIHCNKIKPISEFYKNRNQCKKCKKLVKKQWEVENPEYYKKHSIEWKKNNKEQVKQYKKQYYEKNKKEINFKKKQRKKNDVEFNMKCLMRYMLNKTFRLIGTKKEGRTNDELGYSPKELMQRLEMNFTEVMDWNNYGEWEIDHKLPMSYLIKKGITNPKLINSLCNLQPLWKTNKVINGIFYIGNQEKADKLLY